MIQEVLFDRAERRIQREFGWERYEHADGTALFTEDGRRFLAERDLGWIVDDFIDLDRLNELENTPLNSGHYACTHQLVDSDVVVKRYYPYVYAGGHKYDNQLRQISESSVLRDLAVNLALENALKDDETYIVPRYLGHMMLKSTRGQSNRHYTLMTKFDILSPDEFEALPEDDKVRDKQLRDNFEGHCRAALRANGSRTKSTKFDVYIHTCNMPAIRDPETGELKIGVIDAETRRKWRKPVDGPLIAYAHNDANAPWLTIDEYGFSAKLPANHESLIRSVAPQEMFTRFVSRQFSSP